MTLTNILVRIGLAASLIVSAASHAYLYVHGYQHIPDIGPAFMAQASLSFAIALLILVGGPVWLRWAGAAVAAGSLVAFVLSRTVGLSGFSERGWEPAPYAAVSVAAEVVTVVLWGLGGRFRLRGGQTTVV
ncbi:hypothetical protein MYSE111917_15910 [Mycobacterium senriense]|uniref:DUF4345 domain-containing protein n=1 Tax=Mycobacterium senriense TaxID=2775496 RepID=A0ABM7SI90_9MYCO|nr:hypothetical protein [Mycobacterium senriense]BCZ20783.1 hypothetical protein MTY59_06380 [Mycobacterium senriense]